MADSFRIAIVEDDPSVSRSLATLLDSSGYDTSVYGSAEEFLASADVAANDCLIVDVRLPGISGLDLLELLAEEGQARPSIITTGHADSDTLRHVPAAAAVAFLSKPCDPFQLLSVVESAVNDRL